MLSSPRRAAILRSLLILALLGASIAPARAGTRTAIVDIASGHVVNIVELGAQTPSPHIVESVSPPAGQLFVADPAAQIGWSYANGIFTAPPEPPPSPPTPDQVLGQKFDAGIAITSTGAPALNATYALDQTSQDQIFKIGTYANQFGAFPSGASTQAYPDAAQIPHTFTVPQFVALLKAVAGLVSALETQAAISGAGGTPSWPAQSATIP